MIPYRKRQPRKLHSYFEKECMSKITHCLREMQTLHHANRSGSYAYTILATELTTWREALELYRKSKGVA